MNERFCTHGMFVYLLLVSWTPWSFLRWPLEFDDVHEELQVNLVYPFSMPFVCHPWRDGISEKMEDQILRYAKLPFGRIPGCLNVGKHDGHVVDFESRLIVTMTIGLNNSRIIFWLCYSCWFCVWLDPVDSHISKSGFVIPKQWLDLMDCIPSLTDFWFLFKLMYLVETEKILVLNSSHNMDHNNIRTYKSMRTFSQYVLKSLVSSSASKGRMISDLKPKSLLVFWNSYTR